jgi:type IV pilus assembly protein PilC
MYWYLLPVVVAGLFVALRVAYTSPRGRKHWDRLVLRLPIFGKLVHKTIIARFCRTLGTLLRGGVPILRALDVVRAVAGNTLVVQAVEEAAVNVRAGASLAEPMARSGVFPPLVTQMITVGEETGALDTMLERVAAFYESEVETLVARLASLIEPVLIVGLGAIVGFIVIAILLPYFQMLGSL